MARHREFVSMKQLQDLAENQGLYVTDLRRSVGGFWVSNSSRTVLFAESLQEVYGYLVRRARLEQAA